MEKLHPHYVERGPDPPEIQWAIKLLEPDSRCRGSIFQEYYHYIMGPSAAMIFTALRNRSMQQPFLHNPPLLAGRILLGLVVGHVIGIKQAELYAKRDADMRDYIRAHPEHFSDPNTKKWGEVFEEWTPVR